MLSHGTKILQAENRQKVDVFERRMYISVTTDIDAKIFSVFEHTIDRLFYGYVH